MSPRFSSLLVAVCLTAVASAAPANPAGTVTAAFSLQAPGSTYGAFGGSSIPKYRGQTFTAEVSGRLDCISLRAGHTDEGPEAVRIGVHAVDGNGLPVFPALTSKDFPGSLLPLGELEDVVTFDLSDVAVDLVAGTTYAITAIITPLASGPVPYFLNGSFGTNATYAGGEALTSTDGVGWEVNPTTDWAFEVRVSDPVSTEGTSLGNWKQRYGSE